MKFIHPLLRIAALVFALGIGIAPTAWALDPSSDATPTTQQVPADSGKGYINSQGNWIPSPRHSQNGAPPPGASAHCRDGTYSFSASRRGTCSHHGGVGEWL